MNHRKSTRLASVAVLTVSDTRSIETDKSGQIAADRLTAAGHSVFIRELIRDVEGEITMLIEKWANDESIDLIVVTGGTGPSPRDVTPNAILPLLSSTLPGFGELFRQLSYEEIGSASFLSRADAGWIDNIKNRTPVFILPGSPKAVTLAMDKIIIPQLSHLLDVCLLDTNK